MIGKPVSTPLGSSIKNFPYKCFYSEEKGEIYSFYRQGYAFIINPKDPSKYDLQRMTEKDLGSMYLIYDQVLVVRSSMEVLFFKIVFNEDE